MRNGGTVTHRHKYKQAHKKHTLCILTQTWIWPRWPWWRGAETPKSNTPERHVQAKRTRWLKCHDNTWHTQTGANPVRLVWQVCFTFLMKACRMLILSQPLPLAANSSSVWSGEQKYELCHPSPMKSQRRELPLSCLSVNQEASHRFECYPSSHLTLSMTVYKHIFPKSLTFSPLIVAWSQLVLSSAGWM